MEQKPIPSPYLPHPESPSDVKFLKEIDEVCRRNGHPEYFMAFAERVEIKGGEIMWKGFSNTLTEKMVDYLEVIAKVVRQTWNITKGLK